MKKLERLKLYKKMLSEYQWARRQKKLFDGSSPEKCSAGFCRWLVIESRTNLSEHVEINDLPELIKAKFGNNGKPEIAPLGGYWFFLGELNPRIALLKKAIELCKNSELTNEEIYRKMLADYKRARTIKRWTLGLFPLFTYSLGFCNYLLEKKEKLDDIKVHQLIELKEDAAKVKDEYNAYWFDKGDLNSRIDLLETTLERYQ